MQGLAYFMNLLLLPKAFAEKRKEAVFQAREHGNDDASIQHRGARHRRQDGVSHGRQVWAQHRGPAGAQQHEVRICVRLISALHRVAAAIFECLLLGSSLAVLSAARCLSTVHNHVFVGHCAIAGDP